MYISRKDEFSIEICNSLTTCVPLFPLLAQFLFTCVLDMKLMSGKIQFKASIHPINKANC